MNQENERTSAAPINSAGNSGSPLFSIVTVTLNAGDSLIKTARSVLSQDFTLFEYIVKDGLSSDGSIEAVQKSDGIRVICRSDKGIYDAMNQALEDCRGEYICFMNAGDIFYQNNVLGRVASIIQSNQGYSIFYGNVLLEDKLKSHPKRLSSAFLYEGHICYQAVFVKRDLYLALNGFDTHYQIFADRDFLMRALWIRREKSLLLPFIICNYDMSGISAQSKYYNLKTKEYKEIQDKYFSSWDKALIHLYINTFVKMKVFLKSIFNK
jgi:glycosyltransferase involved in cell wall biosynthesis